MVVPKATGWYADQTRRLSCTVPLLLTKKFNPCSGSSGAVGVAAMVAVGDGVGVGEETQAVNTRYDANICRNQTFISFL